MTQPDAVEALSAALRTDVDAVWAQILAEQEQLLRDWPGLTKPIRHYRLRALQAAIRDLADRADEVAALHVTSIMVGAYETGAWVAATAASVTAAFSGVDTQVISILAQDTMSDLLRANNGVRESTKQLIRALTRDHIRMKVYTGLTAEQAGVRLAADLADQGIHAVTYANGRKVGLTTYTDMVVRTKTAEAYQEGGFQQGHSLGIEYWEVMDGGGCGWTSHDDPQEADGMIVTLAKAEAYPLSHPNCRRATSPRPDILTAEEAKNAQPTPTEAQRANQREAERRRAEAHARRPRRVGLDAQVARRRARAQNLQEGVRSTPQQRHDAIIARSAARAVKRAAPSV